MTEAAESEIIGNSAGFNSRNRTGRVDGCLVEEGKEKKALSVSD